MTARYLLDTNVLSDPIAQRPNPALEERLLRHRGEVATASPVWHELLFGTYRLPASKRRKTLEAYFNMLLGHMPILAYDDQAAKWHATERARLYKRTPPFVDGQIAAVAAVNNLIIVTNNMDDYQIFQGIKVENWHRA